MIKIVNTFGTGGTEMSSLQQVVNRSDKSNVLRPENKNNEQRKSVKRLTSQEESDLTAESDHPSLLILLRLSLYFLIYV